MCDDQSNDIFYIKDKYISRRTLLGVSIIFRYVGQLLSFYKKGINFCLTLKRDKRNIT